MIELGKSDASIIHSPAAGGMCFKHDYDDMFMKTSLKMDPANVFGKLAIPVEQHPCGLLLFEMHRLPIQTSPQAATLDPTVWPRHETIVVDCLYFNPVTDLYTLVDRQTVFAEQDGEPPVEVVAEMLVAITNADYLAYSIVLMDSWYASREIILLTEGLGKNYWGKVEGTRLLCRDADGQGEIKRQLKAEELIFNDGRLGQGKVIHLSTFPFEHRVRIFLINPTNSEKSYIVTNQLSQDQVDAAAMMYDVLSRRLN